MPEADNDRVAEAADAVRERAQVAVVATSSDLRDRGEGGIPLQDRGCTMPANRLREGSLERFPPAAVIPDEVRLLADCLGETRDRLVRMERPSLIDPQVRGRIRRKGRGRSSVARG